MLDLRYTVDHPDEVAQGLTRRGEGGRDLDQLAELSASRRAKITESETLRAERNVASDAMARVSDKKSEEFQKQREALRSVGARIKELESELKEIESALSALLLTLPNLPADDVPDGLSEEQNVEVRVGGTRPEMAFAPRDHVDLGLALGMMDFERAARVHGSRFVVLRGAGARLTRALMQFMLDVHIDRHGYSEVWSPVLVKSSAMLGTSQLPKFADDAFRIAQEPHHAEASPGDSSEQAQDVYLVPTAEVCITNLHAGEILDAAELPKAYCGYTPCFRREAGSYGKDTRGMIRVHQFDKVELVRFCTEQDGPAEFERLTEHAETILKLLGLHYRVMALCAGDLGFQSRKTYDLEVWLPAQNRYREISSCSWCGDFQARRMKCRYRPAPKEKPRFAHTLNGSGLAIGRTLVALLEQNQQADGSVRLPEVLWPYMGGARSLVP